MHLNICASFWQVCNFRNNPILFKTPESLGTTISISLIFELGKEPRTTIVFLCEFTGRIPNRYMKKMLPITNYQGNASQESLSGVNAASRYLL
jgi:hypothetical protein